MNAKWLENMLTIVTGGGSGFGEGIALLFAAHGAQVVVADIDDANGKGVLGDLSTQGAEAIFCRADARRDTVVEGLNFTAVFRFT